MRIQCHLKETKIDINCGSGKNTIRWLANAATTWYIETNSSQLKKQKIISVPIKVTNNISEQLQMEEMISNVLHNNDSVYVFFKQDLQWQSLGKGK